MPFDITSNMHNPHCHKGCFYGGKRRIGLQTPNIDCSKTLLVVESVEQYMWRKYRTYVLRVLNKKTYLIKHNVFFYISFKEEVYGWSLLNFALYGGVAIRLSYIYIYIY